MLKNVHLKDVKTHHLSFLTQLSSLQERILQKWASSAHKFCILYKSNFTDASFLRRNIFPTSQTPFQTSQTPFQTSQTSIHQHPKHQFLYLATFPTSQGPFPTSQTRPNGIINTPCIDFYTSWHFQHPMHRFLYIVAEVKPRQEDSHASTNNFYEYKISIVER